MSESVDELLKGIISSLRTTKSTIDSLSKEEEYPQIIQELVKKLDQKNVEGVSLLALKNNSVVSYLNNVLLVVLSHLERLEGEEVEDIRDQIIKNSIVQRVNIEKGVKPLEKKLNYQLDKMVRTYNRMEADEEKIKKKSENDSGSDSDSNSDSEDDNLSYKPDAAALAKMTNQSGRSTRPTSGKEEPVEAYKPPKIAAVAPPTSTESTKADKTRKLQSMEEYLHEQSDLPNVETSIGSTIVDHGRGGVKTDHDRKKEMEVQNYEESNFTRLPVNQTKKNYKQKQRDMANQYGGEDWSMFNSGRSMDEGVKRKQKANSVWDRVKKRK